MEIVWRPRHELTSGEATRASSVIERRESTTSRNQTAGSRLLLIGELSFAVVLLGWLIYALTHMRPKW